MSTTRRWHLAHADGREWEEYELDELLAEMLRDRGIVGKGLCDWCVNDEGSLFLLDLDDRWVFATEALVPRRFADDLRVVFDE